jgi:sugar phosphate isomerase/epimerase
MRPDQIALQLYTVRRLLADDLPATLRAVAAAGYRSVEIAGVPEREQPELGPQLRDAGLSAVAAHVGLEQLRAGVEEVADWLAGMACPRLIVPSLPEDERSTVDGLRRLTDELNEHASTLAARDIRLGYHNHASEFAPLGQTTAWDVLLADLAPTIEIELDVYWASVGGRDPVTEIRRSGDRVRLLHMKDRAPGSEPHDAPAGAGTLDIAAIVTAAEEARVDWFIAEQDDPGDEIAEITTAYRNLAALAS